MTRTANPPPPRLDDVMLFGCVALVLLGMIGSFLLGAAVAPW